MNQKQNFENKKKELNGLIEEKKRTIEELKQKKQRLEEESASEIDKKSNLLKKITADMDELSKFFSELLSSIQTSLQNQIDKISENWEKNVTDHMKRYNEFVENFHKENNN